MSREDIKKELQKIKDRRIVLAMIDRWEDSYYDTDRELANKEFELEQELEAMSV